MASKIFVFVILAIVIVNTFAATVSEVSRDESILLNRIRRDSDEPECQSNTPCGWLVYAKYTRKHTFFMKNKCECPEQKKCVKAEDDLSVSAYVFKCKISTEDNKVIS